MDVLTLVLIWVVALVAIGLYGWREGLRVEREAQAALMLAVAAAVPEISRAFDDFALSVEEAAANLRRFLVVSGLDLEDVAALYGEEAPGE